MNVRSAADSVRCGHRDIALVVVQMPRLLAGACWGNG